MLPPLEALRRRIDALETASGARAVSVAVYDTSTQSSFRQNADRWFHAASTIKIAVLLGLFDAIHQGRLVPQSRLHVRNRFASAYDGSPFRVLPDRDANATVHDALGKTMRISELALHMIATSSNLATNLLLDYLGLAWVQRTIDALGIDGVDIRRGVEDDKAFEHGIINRTTANGLASMLRTIAEGRAFTPELSGAMLDILHRQEFRNGIPARLPRGTRVAHKTGDISTVAHDAGVVYPPGQRPYVVAILTEWRPDARGRSATIAAISELIYQHLHARSAGLEHTHA